MKIAPVEYAIDVQGISRRFGSVRAVDDLTLRIRSGARVGLIGLDGAGKTTALRMMAGLLRRDSGSIHIDGQPVGHPNRTYKAHVGYVPAKPNVYPWMRVHEAISFTRSFFRTWSNERCTEMMARFKIKYLDEVKKLSKEHARQLSLVLALSHEPPVLMMDEAAGELDPTARQDILDVVRGCATERKQTVLLVSSALENIRRFADSVALMHKGKLLLHETVDELTHRLQRVELAAHAPGAKSRLADSHELSIDDVCNDILHSQKEHV